VADQSDYACTDLTVGTRRKEQGAEEKQQHGQQIYTAWEYFAFQYMTLLFQVSVTTSSCTVAASNLYSCSEKWWWPEQTLGLLG